MVYNLIAVGLVIMVFVIFVPRGIAGIALVPRRMLRRDAVQRPVRADRQCKVNKQ